MLLVLFPVASTEIVAQHHAKSSKKSTAKTERNVSKSNVKNHGVHDYVDLGLPRGTLWATMNVGANTPEDYGDYFVWGETKPKSKYTAENSLVEDIYYVDGTMKYNELPADRDAATANWGFDWRMPSDKQIIELLDGCDWAFTSQKGVSGYLGTSKYNNNTIFFPAAGYRLDVPPGAPSLSDAGEAGYYYGRESDGIGGPHGFEFYHGIEFNCVPSYGVHIYGYSDIACDYGTVVGNSVRAVRVSKY